MLCSIVDQTCAADLLYQAQEAQGKFIKFTVSEINWDKTSQW